jgi:hypothetical protein
VVEEKFFYMMRIFFLPVSLGAAGAGGGVVS